MTIENPVEILLVEDNPDDIEMALNALEQHHIANRILVVRDGAAALDYMFSRGAYAGRDKQTPRVILLDLKLPLVDGLEVLRQLKEDPRTRAVPVVIMTASREEQDLVESYRLGVNSYIVKPVDFVQFTRAMRTIGLYWLLLNELPTP
ncbi:response regulator [Rhodocaloribacter sp.]